jgi:hypothetical protein
MEAIVKAVIHQLLWALLLLHAAEARSQDVHGQTVTSRGQPAVEASIEVLDVDKVEGASLGGGVRAAWAYSPSTSVGVGLSYWSDNSSDPLVDETISDLIVGLHGRMISERPAFVPFRTFIDLGVDMHRLTFDVDGGSRRDETRAGWAAGLGGLYELSRTTDIVTGLSYRRIIGDAAVRLDQLAFSGGVNHRL